VNCYSHSKMPDTFFTRVPCIPKNTPNDKSNNSVRYNHSKKLCYRAEFLRRIGTQANETRRDMRICNHHGIERVSKPTSFVTIKGDVVNTTITMDVPSAFTLKSNMNLNPEAINRDNKGSAYNRFESNYRQQSYDYCHQTIGLDWAYNLSQVMVDNERLNNNDVAQQNASSSTNSKRRPLYGIVHKERKGNPTRATTIIQIDNHSNKELAATTGFRSLTSMISFICVVCNADIQEMGHTISNLTWLEEWHLFFERLYGRSVTRMVDCIMKYKTNEKLIRNIFNNKLAAVMVAKYRWPMFATFEEDEMLRDDKWNATYNGKRIVMWDNTDIPLPTPSSSNLQRNTFSDYYNGNVGKGSVFVQLCGWMGTHELWEGAVTDTDYFARSGILKLQQDFLKLYDPEHDNDDHNWIIILDRGYKVVGECFAHGKQKVLQPTFTRIAKPKFSAMDTQLTAAVAHDRGGNERAVKIAKISNFVAEGYKSTVTVDQLCDAWIAWGYQVNFMYKPVL
jgi:DDE superfamily endonuclease